MDEGWSMMDSDGIDDVTILVNSSPSKLLGANPYYNNGFPSVGTAVLCARASMLLQVLFYESYMEKHFYYIYGIGHVHVEVSPT